jgi:putative DNA primase/helicase
MTYDSTRSSSGQGQAAQAADNGQADNGDGHISPEGPRLSEEARETLDYIDFLWPTGDDANVAAQAADFNCTPWTIPDLRSSVRNRPIVIAAQDTEEGQAKAQEVAAQCVKYKADGVRIWTIPGFGSKFGAMREWCTHNSLVATLEVECAGEWRGFVSFVGTPMGICPKFSEDPKPIAVNLIPVPPLEDEMIPKPLRGWILDISTRAQAPVEYVAAAALVAIGGLIGCRLAIRPKRRDHWLVVPNLWGAVVGPPGVLKTPMVEESLRPLKRLAADSRERYQDEMKEWAARKLVLAAKQEAAATELKKAAKKGARDEELAILAREATDCTEEEPPVEARKDINDVTVEKLQVRMSENAAGLLYFRDELTGLFRAMDKQGHESDRGFFLECWNGLNSYRVERMGRPDVYIPRACLAIFGTIQPGPLARYLTRSICGEEADGFMPRFQMLVYPDPPIKFLYVDRFPDTVVKDTAYAVFRAINELDPIALGCEVHEDLGVPFIGFADDAQEYFAEWYTTLQNRLRSGSLSNIMACQLAKYPSLMASLALEFHLIGSCHFEPWFDERSKKDMVSAKIRELKPVSLDAAENAAAWCEFLEGHASRMYQCAIDGDPEDAIRLDEKIRDSLPMPFTIRDVQRKGWAGLRTNEEVRSAIGRLEDCGRVKVVEVPTTERGGRPTEQVWVHPKLMSGTPGVHA